MVWLFGTISFLCLLLPSMQLWVRDKIFLCHGNYEVQAQSVTVTPSGNGKSVTVSDCHSNSIYLFHLVPHSGHWNQTLKWTIFMCLKILSISSTIWKLKPNMRMGFNQVFEDDFNEFPQFEHWNHTSKWTIFMCVRNNSIIPSNVDGFCSNLVTKVSL